MNEKIITLGAYVKGVMDVAASRGLLTRAAQATMVNALRAIHGEEFEIEPMSPPPVPATSETAAQASEAVAARQEQAKADIAELTGIKAG